MRKPLVLSFWKDHIQPGSEEWFLYHQIKSLLCTLLGMHICRHEMFHYTEPNSAKCNWRLQFTKKIHTWVGQIYQEQGHNNLLNLSFENQNAQCTQRLKREPKVRRECHGSKRSVKIEISNVQPIQMKIRSC